ncbi:MAG: type II secretion system protein [Candidatus Shapirobacteria bacterium]|nr:type II secretion system protein [Candidatus Shapirobacteria bacterium]
MKKIKIDYMKGFTLVELLIVIALIAILSVAVLATINPIEQSNKARDAKFKNDAAEVLSAYERYYTSQTSYPWMDVETNPTDLVQTTVVFASDDAHFGVVRDAAAVGDGTGGLLIDSSELKSSFLGKESYTADLEEENRMYVYHNGSTNDNYVCFHPKAAANRVLIQGTSASLKCIDVDNAVINDYGENGCAVPIAGWDASAVSAANANLVCVPEGAIE